MKQAIPHKHLKTGLSQVPCRIKDIYAAWTLTFKQANRCDNAHSNVNPQKGGEGRAYAGYLIINCIPTLGILISILAPSWGNLNQMVGYLTNIYCPTVGHLIDNFLKKSNAPPMPDPPPPLGLNIDRCIISVMIFA